MNFISRCNKLTQFVFKRNVLTEQTGVLVFRGVYPTSVTSRCHSSCPLRRFTSTSTSREQQQRRVFTCDINSKRWFSEIHGENNESEKSGDLCPEEEEEVDVYNRAPSPRTTETFGLDVLVALLRQENAVDICVIKVPDNIKYTEYFIVASGVSPRHLRAMALYAIKVYKFLKKDGDPNVRIEGKDADDWMCIDFGKMVVHFMMPETRDVYELEKLWTLRSYDEQLKMIPAEKIPEDFVYDIDVTK